MKDPEFETRLLHALEVLCEKITALNVTMTDLAQKLVPKVDEPAKVEPRPWLCVTTPQPSTTPSRPKGSWRHWRT